MKHFFATFFAVLVLFAAYHGGGWYERRFGPYSAPIAPRPVAPTDVTTLRQHASERARGTFDYHREALREEGFAIEYVRGRFHEGQEGRAICGRAFSSHAPPGTWDCTVTMLGSHYFNVSCIGATCEGTRAD